MPFRTAVTSTRPAICVQLREEKTYKDDGAEKIGRSAADTLLDQTAFDRVKYRLKPIMGAKLLVDRMKVVSQSWQSDVQVF